MCINTLTPAETKKIAKKSPRPRYSESMMISSATKGRIINIDYATTEINPTLIDTSGNIFSMFYGGLNPLMYDAESGVLIFTGRILSDTKAGTKILGFGYSEDSGISWMIQNDLNEPDNHNFEAQFPSLVTGAIIDGLAAPIIIYSEEVGGGGEYGGDPILLYNEMNFDESYWNWVDFHNIVPYPDLYVASPVITTGNKIFTSFISFTTGEDYYIVYEADVSAVSVVEPNLNSSIFPADVPGSAEYASVFNNTAYNYVRGNHVAVGGAWDMNESSSSPRNLDRNLIYKISSDNGATWGAPVLIEEKNIVGFPAQSFDADAFISEWTTSMVIDPFGSVHFFVNIIETLNRQKSLISHIGLKGGEWTLRVIDTLDFELSSNETCDIGCGLTQPFITPSGLLALVFTAGTSKSDTTMGGMIASDLFISISSDLGATWTEPENITNSPGINETKIQGSPTVEVGDNGSETLHLVYLVDVEEPLGDQQGKHVYYHLAHTLSIVSVIENEKTFPINFELEQNYPNPFNPGTTISFRLQQKSEVDLNIYNILGQQVALLIKDAMEIGSHEVYWDASKFAAGIYFYKLTANGKSRTNKMILLK